MGLGKTIDLDAADERACVTVFIRFNFIGRLSLFIRIMLERLARKHFERGRQFELQDREKEAVIEFERACDLKPSFADPFLSLGRIRAMGGQLTEAIALLDAALDRSDDPQIRQWRGYVYGRMRRYREALLDYQAIDDGMDPHVRVNIGRMYLALGEFDEADEALSDLEEPSAKQLRDALPRYREFTEEPSDDSRALRYLFGGTLVLGTEGDGGVRLRGDRYLLLTPRHIAATMRRFVRFAERFEWRFDGVAGEGAHHGPIALAMAEILGLPLVKAGESEHTLLCSAVLKGPVEAVRVDRAWRSLGHPLMHFCAGLIPTGDPDPKEPELVGFVSRCAVPWYRVEPFSRLEAIEDGDNDSPWPGFRIGPAFVDPNGARVSQTLLEAYALVEDDPIVELIFSWYERHRLVRAFGYESSQT